MRHVGGPVAVVIADSLAQARTTRRGSSKIDYAVEPAVTDVAEALKPGAPLWCSPGCPSNICYDWHIGDPAVVDAAMSKGRA